MRCIVKPARGNPYSTNEKVLPNKQRFAPFWLLFFLFVELQPHFYHSLPKTHFMSSAIIRLLQKGSRMKNKQCTTFIHADDFGITPVQSKEILSLSSSCNGIGALNSVSIFANSPAFDEAASLAQPYVDRGVLRVCLHLNLVEGPSLSNPERIPLLVNEHGMFKNSFIGLLKLGIINKHAVFDQLVIECRNQIQRYFIAVPQPTAFVSIRQPPTCSCYPCCLQSTRASFNRRKLPSFALARAYRSAFCLPKQHRR